VRTWHHGYVLSTLYQVTPDNRVQADITDLQRHFEIEVPRRALSNPLLRFAIFAFSSQHLNRHQGCDSLEALQYHSQCVRLLMPILSGREEELTEDVLAAVAILRQYEEMDGESSQNRFGIR
jgi:Fungal specific transcription factor domain